MDSFYIQLFLKQNFAHTISYLGAIQGLILAVIVWNYPQEHKTSNRILSLFLLSLVYLYIGPRVLDVIDSPYQRLYYGFRTIAPILLILYIHSLHKKVLDRKYFLFFLLIPVDILVTYSITRLRLNDQETFLNWRIFSHTWFIIIYLFYLPIIYNQYQEYKSKVLQNFSSTHRIGLKWVTQLFLGFMIIMTFDFLISVVALNFSVLDGGYASMASTVAFTAFMYFITIKGKLSSQIYQLRNLDVSPKVEHSSKIEEEQNLTENEDLNELAQKITKSIEINKLYKEMGLTVGDIAEKIDSQPYLVSQAINTCLGKNFFELINRYRVEEAKNLLLDESWNYLSIVGIGFEAGFNSKTAFNTSFKKFTGVTPSQFKKEKLRLENIE